VDGSKTLVIPLNRDDNLKHVVFARMAFVGMTAVQIASAHPTQTVLVVGLGVVGNLAAQLFQLAGCQVLGFDVLAGRLKRARECGIENLANSGVREPLESVQNILGGKADIVVEAIGKPSIITQVMDWCRPGGQVILLGSPRGKANIDATEVLQRVHIASYNVTLRGAHEWIYPVHAADDPNGFTMERGAQFILNWIRQGKLKIEPLITAVYNPCDAQKAYDGLLQNPDEYLGVLFDWSKVS
jgi:threonine dehydrogenase-like Zn-dependent dehydrogenase